MISLFQRTYIATIISVVIMACSKNDTVMVDILPDFYSTPDSIRIAGYVRSWGNNKLLSRGFCYSLTENPTIENEFLVSSTDLDERLFKCTINNLISDTLYYVRCYAEDDKGQITYSSEVLEIRTRYSIGSTGPGGGIVFSINGSGGGMEVVEIFDSDGLEWGCTGTYLGSNYTSFGMGDFNSNLIATNCDDTNIAAKKCENFSFNGFDDWFLPSLDELLYMRLSIYDQLEASLSTKSFFWSSTEQNNNNSWALLFFDGTPQSISKNSKAGVLAVRYF